MHNNDEAHNTDIPQNTHNNEQIVYIMSIMYTYKYQQRVNIVATTKHKQNTSREWTNIVMYSWKLLYK